MSFSTPGTQAHPVRPMDFKEFERASNAWRAKVQNQQRKAATGTLTPADIERGIRSKTGVTLPERQGKGYYSPDELKAFRKLLKGVQKEFDAAKRGVPLKMLIARTQKPDVERANQQIKYARLYQVYGNMLKFQVPASGESGYNGSYQVRIRLEDWDSALVSGKAWNTAAKQAANGRVSIDCQCGRHQFWYRYLAGVGGYAVEPPQEKDFPKIRNPSLKGACCKHVVKCLITLQSPTVQRVLAQELSRQASAAGFGKTAAHYLTKDDHEKLKRARPKPADQKTAAAAYKDYLKSFRGVAKSAKKAKDTMTSDEVTQLKAKDKQRRQQLKQAREREAQARQAAQLAQMSAALNKARMDAVMQAAMNGANPQAAHQRATETFAEQWAAQHGGTVAAVLQVIKEQSL